MNLFIQLQYFIQSIKVNISLRVVVSVDSLRQAKGGDINYVYYILLLYRLASDYVSCF